jgi:hypothetical protein
MSLYISLESFLRRGYKQKRKPVSSLQRSDIWVYYGSKFIERYHDEVWFQKLNPPDRVYLTMKCYACHQRNITERTYPGTFAFEIGHVQSYKQSSLHLDLTNIRPICRECNRHMSSSDMFSFIEKMNYQGQSTLFKELREE